MSFCSLERHQSEYYVICRQNLTWNNIIRHLMAGDCTAFSLHKIPQLKTNYAIFRLLPDLIGSDQGGLL